MKVVYKNGQKFIITNALYEAQKSKNREETFVQQSLFADMQDDKNLTSDNVSTEQNPSTKQTSTNKEKPKDAKKTSTKWKLFKDQTNTKSTKKSSKNTKQGLTDISKTPKNIYVQSDDMYNGAYARARNVVQGDIRDQLTYSDEFKSAFKKFDLNEQTLIAGYMGQVIATILAEENAKQMIKQSNMDDVATTEGQIIAKIKTAMLNYLKIVKKTGKEKKELAKAVVEKLNSSGRSSPIKPSIASIEEALGGVLINSKRSGNGSPSGMNDQDHEIKIYYYLNTNGQQTMIDYGDRQSEVKNGLLKALIDNKGPIWTKISSYEQISFPLSNVHTEPGYNIVVGKDNIVINLENTDIDIWEFVSSELKLACVQLAKTLGGVFNSSKDVMLKIIVDGEPYQDSNISEENETKINFLALHNIVMDPDYEINKSIQQLVGTIQALAKIQGSDKLYNEAIQSINGELSVLSNNIFSTEIPNENKLIQCLNDVWEITNKKGTSTPNTEVVDTIVTSLGFNSTTNNNEQSNTLDNDLYNLNNAKTNKEKIKIQLDKAEALYKYKKRLDNIEINDYYTIDEVNDSINIEDIQQDMGEVEKAIDDLLKKLKYFMGVKEKDNGPQMELNFTSVNLNQNTEYQLYQEYVYIKTLGNICNVLLDNTLRELDDKDIQKLKKRIKKYNHGDSGKKIRNNPNLQKFFNISGHLPSYQDIDAYELVYKTIREYRAEMKRAEKLAVDGMAEYGIFKQEVDIRPINNNAYKTMLKNEALKKSKIKDAMAYTYLTKFAQDIQSIKKETLNPGDQKLKALVHKIVPTNKDEQITFDFVTKSVLKEMLIFTNIDMQDVLGAFKEDDAFLERFSTGAIRYGEEGEGNKVYTVPIISEKLGKKCIGIIRIRRIFARTRSSASKLFKHDLFRKMFDDLKNL